MPKQTVGEYEVTVEVGKNELTEYEIPNGGGRSQSWRWVKTGESTHRVRLEIDFDAIISDLGRRAVKSKRGIAKFMGGAVVVRDLGVKP
jgi:hypothetical protein